jgi:homoserine dehydrogenase
VGLLGCGVVGGGVLRLLAANRAAFEARVGVPLAIKRVLVRDRDKPRVPELDPGTLTTDPNAVLGDPSVEVVVEVMGGEEPAGEYVARAMTEGRCVVTANKALLAARGPALLDLAAERRVDLAFEAAVGGGIPVIRTLRDAFASDDVVQMVGILNGTCNYVLTRMSDEGASFDAVLAAAQRLGYAEADPSLDVDGHDAAHKLVVLAMLAFGARPPHPGMIVEGIRGIDRLDVETAARFGYAVKHLVVGRDHGDAVELRAHPALVKKSSVLAAVSGVLNAIRLEGRALGPCFLSGRGAGDMPTAVSVVADILDVARSIVAGVPGLLTAGRALAPRPILPAAETMVRHYLRLAVRDEPGVMARITAALGDAGVSLSRIEQPEASGAEADVVLVTHLAREGAVKAALAKMDAERVLLRPGVHLRIEDA